MANMNETASYLTGSQRAMRIQLDNESSTFTRAAGYRSNQLELTPQCKCLMMTNGFFLISIITITVTITPPFIINIKAVIAWVDSHLMLVFTCQFLFRKSPMSVTTVTISDVAGRPVETRTDVIFFYSLC